MSSYQALASWYDRLTQDVPYAAFADFYESEFRRRDGAFKLLLDLCCGTGTLTAEMARRGYELIGADASVDMLMQAQAKCASLPVPPLFLCQKAQELDLYGTVDAAYCSLDGMNYLAPELLGTVFSRLRLFIRPGGLLLFDVRLPEWFRSLDGEVFVDETEDLLCLWRADFDEGLWAMRYGMDLFTRKGRLWARSGEEHVEYAHEPAQLKALLEASGFVEVAFHPEAPQGDAGRLHIVAVRGENDNG